MSGKDVTVRLMANTTQYQAAMGQASRATAGVAASSQAQATKMSSAWGATAKTMGMFAAGGAVVAGLKASVNAAVDLEESINAVNVTFGDAADGILALSENSARSVGLASADFNGLAVQFAAFAEQVAGPGGDVVGVIDDLTVRAADFASVMNIDVNEAARIFGSTLAGESEPIRRFGHNISAAAVEQYLLAEGIVETKDQITDAMKVQGRYELLMQSTAKTAGDFANTSDSLANQQRILKAEMTNLAAAIGDELVPMISDAAAVALDAVDAFNRFNDAVEENLGQSAIEIGGNVALAPLKALNEYNNKLLGFVGIGSDASDATRELNAEQRALIDTLLDPVLERFSGDMDDADVAMTNAARSMGNLGNESGGMTIAVQSADTAMLGYARSTNSMVDAQESAAAAAAEHEQALADLFDEVDRNLSTMFDYEAALLDIANGAAELGDAEAELNQQLAENEIGLETYQIGMRNVRLDEIALAEAALQTAEIYAEQQGAVEGTTESYALQKEELIRLASQFPFLRDEIALYIAELNRIPSVIGTQITIGYSSNGVPIRSSGDSISFGNGPTEIQGFDSGGIIGGPIGSPQLVLAHGGETVFPTHKQPLASMMGAGAVNFNGGITVVTQARDGQALLNDFLAAVRRQGPAAVRQAIGV